MTDKYPCTIVQSECVQMWKLAPTEKLALLLITAGMVAVTSIFVACWVVSTCHDRKGKGSRKKM